MEHVVHETETKFARKSGYVICRPDKVHGEVSASGPVTCKKCLALDVPVDLMPSEQSALRVIAEGRQFGNGGLAGIAKLLRLDYVTEDHRLTRRGLLVAKDFTEGAAPWCDNIGLVHARDPLAIVPRCDRNHIFESLGKLTTERYGKLRLVAEPVTCMACARIAR